ncbi:unnamed protein product [Chironomus riparius]|uniref:HTH CENPB-type domain-containing protein n=1 Tax=Chironomus riparius TaxID=315576 RepID=A0A9N9S6G3_9DIPT|nr:unnamed protein product [Chironomus riparius]
MPPPKRRLKKISDPLVSPPSASKRLKREKAEDVSLDNEDSSPLKREKSSEIEESDLLEKIPVSSRKKQPQRGRYAKYDKEDLLEAVQMVRTKKLSLHNAAKQYNVPKTTILNYVTNGDREHSKRGVEPALKPEEEQQILTWLLDGSDLGVPRTKKDLIQAAIDVLKINNRPNVFKNRDPTHHWIKTFTNRHKSCVRLRNSTSPINEGKFFQKFYSFLDKSDYLDVLKRPDAFYIIEDTNLEFDREKINPERRMLLKKCLTKKSDDPSSYRLKNSATVIYGFGADGRGLQQVVIFRDTFNEMAKVALADRDANANFLYLRTQDGGNVEASLHCYLKRLDAQLKDVERPIFVFCGETLPSVGLELSRWCNEKKIYVISFIPNNVSVLQKFDDRIFGIKNTGWGIELDNYQDEERVDKLSEIDFVKVLKKTNDRVFDEDKIFQAFAEAGVFPFDMTKVNDLPSDYPSDDEDNAAEKKITKISTKIQQMQELSKELSIQLKNKKRDDLVLNVKIITQQLDFVESSL